MANERDGVSVVWLACFLRDAPGSAVIRGYEGEINGMIIEMPSETPDYEGEMIELAVIHNDARVALTDEGRKYMTVDQGVEI